MADKVGEARRSLGLRREVEAILTADDFEESLDKLGSFPLRLVVSPLLSFILSIDEKIKWRAVTAMGVVVKRMAQEDMEGARIVMRRLMWSLNDESGGIGWGAPETMGEIMAREPKLAEEYINILLSYIRSDGNPLENDLLERGAMWGLGRVAKVQPHLLKGSGKHFIALLRSSDPVKRGLAAWILAIIREEVTNEDLEPLSYDHAVISIYDEGKLHSYRISELIEALRKS